MGRNRRPQPQSAPGSNAQASVGRHEARLLWRLVDGAAAETRSPDIDTLALDAMLAVTCEQARNRGVGRGETSVVIGLALLEALPANEVRALLISELASMTRRGPLRRARSGEADRFAAERAGAVVLATALARAELVRRVLDEDYWPAVFHGAHSSVHPQVKPFTSLRRTLRAHAEAGALRAQAGRLLAVEPESDGEPSLSDRLRALGVAPLDAVDAALLPVAAPAAELLGGAYESLLSRLDADWCERVNEWWEQAHRDALREALGDRATPARTWTQAGVLARYRETTESKGLSR
jgi:hypothetical protein